MQQKNHRSISLLLFWKWFLLFCLPLWTLPTFFKNKKRLENKKNVKNVINVTKIKKRKNIFLHLWVKDAGCDLSRPSDRLWLYAGLIGSSSPRWLKADLVVCANPSSASRVWVDDCFFWYRLTRVVPSKGPLNGSVMCVHVCIFFSFVTVRDRVRVLLTCCTALKSTACSNKTIPLNLRQTVSVAYICQYQSSDWLRRPPPKWPILCRVGR